MSLEHTLTTATNVEHLGNTIANKNIALLEQIELTGSISRAAKNVQLGYKAAWDAIEAMNNLSDSPLVICLAGGAAGGTRLTNYGQMALKAWRAAQIEQARWRATQSIQQGGGIERLIRGMHIKSSAQNRFCGRIKTLERGPVNSYVVLDIGRGLEITATVTTTTLEEMELAPGKEAMALVKASFILLATDGPIQISARNRLRGKLSAIIPGTTQSEVKLQLREGRMLTATISNDSVVDMGLCPGQSCTALIKASHVLILA